MSTENEEGAWRITESQRYSRTGLGEYLYPKKYLYDNRKTFERQLKIKKKQANNHPYLNIDDIRLIVERFDGKQWVMIEEWFGPEKVYSY
jgi:hypothetical protein